jgi:GT2 family glycosyltransferase
MPAPRVRLVVLNYNGGALVERCVEHLEALDWPADRLDLVVVDNCSSDGSDGVIERGHPRVRVVRTPENLGFPGNNVALRDLDGIDYVGLINNDAFVEPELLGPLIDALDADEHLGAVCPKIVLEPRFASVQVTAPVWYPAHDDRALSVRVEGLRVDGRDVFDAAVFGDGCYGVEHGDHGPFHWLSDKNEVHVPAPAADGQRRVASVLLRTAASVEVTVDAGAEPVTVEVGPELAWVDVELGDRRYDIVNNVGSILVEDGSAGDRGFLEPDLGQYDEPAEVFAWCGAGVLLRSAYLEEAGLLDERFFMYYEDTDLAWRGRALGWRYRYVPSARMRHVHAATSVEGSPMFRFWVERNRLFMLTKCAPAPMALRAVGALTWSIVASLGRDGVRQVLRGRRPSLGFARTRTRSLLSYLRHLVPMLRDRRRLRRRQVVPDAAILDWAVRR